MYNLRFEISNLKFPGTFTVVENPLQIGPIMQNKANFKIGKMNINIAVIKDYDNEQQTTNNERYSKQTQTKPIFTSEDRRQKLVRHQCGWTEGRRQKTGV